MNAPHRPAGPSTALRIGVALPAWLVLAFAGSLIANMIATAFLAVAIMLHLIA